MSGRQPPVRTLAEIEIMRTAGGVVAEVLDLCRELARPGVTTGELDRQAEALIRRRGGVPLFKGYRGYPSSICASVNEEVVHGIPGARALNEGDLLSVDVGVRLDGFCADAATTCPVGKVSEAGERLMRVCREALDRGIRTLRPGMRLSTLCRAIQLYVESQGCSVVRQYTGHGIGREMHEEPQVPNFVAKGMPDPVLPEGTVLAIEPMINAGRAEVKLLDNGWTVVTRDGALSAHFEHTVALREAGPDILTLRS